MDDTQCSGCRFWERNGPDGICRRGNPVPMIAPVGAQLIVVWPTTRAEEWCGNFDRFQIGAKS